MSYDKRYANLKYLMEHFHQDWKEIYKSDADLLADFSRQHPAELVASVVAEIAELLETEREPSKVDALLTKKWQSETPYKTADDAIKWLRQVARILQRRKAEVTNKEKVARPNIEKYPGLYLLMCQFDASWKEVFGSERNLLKEFRKAHSREDLAACVGDIRKILDSKHSDDDLYHLLNEEFGANQPRLKKTDVRKWLHRLLAGFHGIEPGEWRS